MIFVILLANYVVTCTLSTVEFLSSGFKYHTQKIFFFFFSFLFSRDNFLDVAQADLELRIFLLSTVRGYKLEPPSLAPTLVVKDA